MAYVKTVEISTSMEMAEREAADMRNTTNSKRSALNFMDKKKKMVTCYYCGKKVTYQKTVVLRVMHLIRAGRKVI